MKKVKLLNIKKYVKEHCPELLDYASTFHGNLESGIFEWNEDKAWTWSPPWGKTGVMMLLEDRSNSNFLQDGYEDEGYPSTKCSFRCYLAGVDDVSYSKVFDNMEDMYDCAADLISKPNYNNMIKLGFVFTN